MNTDPKENHYTWGDGCEGWRLLAGPDLSVIREIMPPGRSERTHYHERSRQYFYVLNGQLTMFMNGRREVLHSHQGVEIQPSVPHQAVNESPHDVEFLVISAPPGQEDRVYV